MNGWHFFSMSSGYLISKETCNKQKMYPKWLQSGKNNSMVIIIIIMKGKGIKILIWKSFNSTFHVIIYGYIRNLLCKKIHDNDWSWWTWSAFLLITGEHVKFCLFFFIYLQKKSEKAKFKLIWQWDKFKY